MREDIWPHQPARLAPEITALISNGRWDVGHHPGHVAAARLHWRAACEIHAGMPPRILLDVLAVNSNDLDLRA